MNISAFQNPQNLEQHRYTVNAELNQEEMVSQGEIWNVLYHRKNVINAEYNNNTTIIYVLIKLDLSGWAGPELL